VLHVRDGGLHVAVVVVAIALVMLCTFSRNFCRCCPQDQDLIFVVCEDSLGLLCVLSLR
jgi:hypothetical protein